MDDPGIEVGVGSLGQRTAEGDGAAILRLQRVALGILQGNLIPVGGNDHFGIRLCRAFLYTLRRVALLLRHLRRRCHLLCGAKHQRRIAYREDSPLGEHAFTCRNIDAAGCNFHRFIKGNDLFKAFFRFLFRFFLRLCRRFIGRPARIANGKGGRLRHPEGHGGDCSVFTYSLRREIM